MTVRAKFFSLLRSAAAPLLVAAIVFSLYMVRSDIVVIADSVWSPHVTASLIYDRDPFLDEYRQWVEEWGKFATFELNDRIHSFFPLGGQLLAIPQTIILDAILPQLRDTTLQEYLISHSPVDPFVGKIQLFNAALLVALSAGVMYLIGREYLRVPYALILTATYAFGTSAYSTAGRAMWQHGPSMLMLSIALLLLVKARKRPVLVSYVGLPLAAAFIIRPTNSVSVLIITLYVLACYRKYFLRYLLFALLPAIAFAFSNINLYGGIFPPYFSTEKLGSPRLKEALLGNLISPARGLLVFSPVMLLVPLGIIIKGIKRRIEPLDWALVMIIILHWIVISTFGHWWAGHSFGPRFFADVMPYCVYFLIPILKTIQSAQASPAVRLGLSGLYVVLLGLSVAIHYRGATSLASHGWNSVPISVDIQSERLWDWSDLQFMRGLGRELIAVVPDQVIVEPGKDTNSQSYYFEIGSMTDGGVDLSLLLPARVMLAEHSAWLFEFDPLPGGGKIGRLRVPLSGLGMQRFDFEVDTTNIADLESLNAIQIVASKDGRDGTTIDQTQVIGLSTGLNPDGPAIRPHDIRIECRAFAPGELFGLFGEGWYDEEAAGDSTWRWASSPAHVYVWSDNEQHASFELAVSTLHKDGTSNGLGDEGSFQITLPDGNKTAIAAQTNQPAQFNMELKPGWNTVRLELESGHFSPADIIPGHFDTRDLSFSVDSLTLSGACDVAAP